MKAAIAGADGIAAGIRPGTVVVARNKLALGKRIPRILREAAGAWVILDICHKDLGLTKTMRKELGVTLCAEVER